MQAIYNNTSEANHVSAVIKYSRFDVQVNVHRDIFLE